MVQDSRVIRVRRDILLIIRADKQYVLVSKRNGFNFEWTIHLTLFVNFDGQFGYELSVSDSLCTAASSNKKKSEKGCLWGRGRLHTG